MPYCHLLRIVLKPETDGCRTVFEISQVEQLAHAYTPVCMCHTLTLSQYFQWTDYLLTSLQDRHTSPAESIYLSLKL